MNILRSFEMSAIRHGFIIDIDKECNYSEIFSLYGFHFELITEKLEEDDSGNYRYQFHIQVGVFYCFLLIYKIFYLKRFAMLAFDV
jgi:hypothetical protein